MRKGGLKMDDLDTDLAAEVLRLRDEVAALRAKLEWE
jgi:hypothetical protein